VCVHSWVLIHIQCVPIAPSLMFTDFVLCSISNPIHYSSPLNPIASTETMKLINRHINSASSPESQFYLQMNMVTIQVSERLLWTSQWTSSGQQTWTSEPILTSSFTYFDNCAVAIWRIALTNLDNTLIELWRNMNYHHHGSAT